jgi:hypothetical protein
VIGTIGASARDLFDVLRVIAGPDGRDAGSSPVPLRGSRQGRYHAHADRLDV